MEGLKKVAIMVLGIIFLIIFIILLIQFKGCKSIKEDNTMYQHLEDSIKTYKNKYGDLVSSTSLLQASSTKQLLDLKSKDETILWLQSEVSKNKDKVKDGGSISVIGTEVYFKGANGTVVSFNTQPVKIGDTVYYYPTYDSKSKDTTWVNYQIKANKDSIHLDLKVKNKYSVVIGSEREKWYKKRKPIVQVSNQNPYDKVKSLKAFEVKDTRSNRFGLGLSVGVGVSPKGVLPYFGIGLNYNLIKF